MNAKPRERRSGMTSDNKRKVVERDVGKKPFCFTVRIVDKWKLLSEKLVEAKSIHRFKDEYYKSQVSWLLS